MSAAVPLIYSPRFRAQRLSPLLRILSAGIGLACLGLLLLAAGLQPSASGVGTHTEMGFAHCQFLERTGLPCPTCGMTTSFAYMAHGHPLESLYCQPMGALLALLSAAGFWIGLYIAFSGRPALSLLRTIPAGYYLFPLMILAIAAWGWKILIHTNGLE